MASNVVALPTSKLLKYEAACRAVAEASSVDEVLQYRNEAIAMQLYGKLAKDNTIVRHGQEIRWRAERRLGQIMKAQEKAAGKAKAGAHQHKANRVSRKPDRPPTLAEAGIDKNLAHRGRAAGDMAGEHVYGAPSLELRQNLLSSAATISAFSCRARRTRAGRTKYERLVRQIAGTLRDRDPNSEAA